MLSTGQTPDCALHSAIAMRRDGNHRGAEMLCRQILEKDESNAAALHLLGVLQHERGEHGSAASSVERALALCPNFASAHASLGEVYRALGELDRSAGSCHLALKLSPECVEAMCNLGLLCQIEGLHEDAANRFRYALQLRPDLAPLHNNLGVSLRELGEWELALAHFRSAVALDPAFAPALNNLGQALLERGQPLEALEHCLEAVKLQPDVAAVHVAAGKVFAALGRLVESRDSYLRALRIDPDMAMAYAGLGLSLQQEARFDEALFWIRSATELDADNAMYHRYLGDLHIERGEPSGAIPSFERALTLATDAEQVRDAHLGIGRALLEDGRPNDAEERYSMALALAPKHSSVHLALGWLRLVQGNIADAATALRTAISLHPGCNAAHARLATLLRSDLPDEDLRTLEVRLEDSKLSNESRGTLLFGLAHALDARGEHARAAHCLVEANRLIVTRHWGRYVPTEHECFIGDLLRVFSQDFLAGLAGSGSDTRRPVFVFGLPRSGTSLVEQILSSHPCVFGAGELRLVGESFRAVPNVVGGHERLPDCVRLLGGQTILTIASRHLDRLSLCDGGVADRIVDKMPGNYAYLGFLSILFPQATFIHCRRDLRDVALSCWFTQFEQIAWSNDPGHIAHHFWQYRRIMNHWREVLPVRVHHVDYEDTVADLEGVGRRLFDACGLEWVPQCLEFHRTRRPVQTASAAQVRKPIYSHSVGRWRNYEHTIADLFSKLPPPEGLPAPIDPPARHATELDEAIV